MSAIITENGMAIATAGVILVVGVMNCCGGEKDSEGNESIPNIGDVNNSQKKKKNQESIQSKAQKAQKAQKEPSKENSKTKPADMKEIDVGTNEAASKKSKKSKGKNGTNEKSKEVVAAQADNTSNSKKKKNKKKGGNGGGKAPEPPSTLNEVGGSEDDDSTPSPSHGNKKQEVQSSSSIEGGWTTVETVSSKKDKKLRERAAAAEEDEVVPVPMVVPQEVEEIVSTAPVEVKPTQPNTTVSVDPKKIGIVIGPKGSTMKRIEELTHCRLRTQDHDPTIQVKSAHIRVEGPDLDSVREACKMVTDLCSKGYSARLEGGDFSESSVEIPSRSVPDLVGSNGVVIKALRDGTGTIVNLPPQKKLATGGADKMVRVSIAGPKAGVAAAKEAIRDILTMYYSPITHPGFTHATFEIADWQVARFCGKAGSNIRHIQGDSKARVHIPRDNSEKKNVIIVGTASQVAIAKKHVNRILEDIKEQANRISSEESFASSHRASRADQDEDEEPHEEWMDEYLYKR